MKIKSTRICACKGCNQEFKLFRSTDKFCSPACAYKSQKAKPQKKQKPIKPMSEKRKAESYVYTRKRRVFLSKPENQICPVAKHIFNQIIQTDQIHHKAGRRGKLLTYVPFFLAVSDKGHKWIHANPEKSYQLKFSIKNTTVNI